MATSKVRSGVWRCKHGFAGPNYLSVAAGTLVPYNAPYEVMDGREELFENIEQPRNAAPAVEQATAAPGEKRAAPKSDKA